MKIDSTTDQLVAAAELLVQKCEQLIPRLIAQTIVTHATNPLDYARQPHQKYLAMIGEYSPDTILLGMNPGPWGMAQCGIPFGATKVATELLGIAEVEVLQPDGMHPKRPVVGLSLERQEVSGTRLWGALAERYCNAKEILSQVFIVNHCPLLLLDEAGRNITPDKLSGDAVNGLLQACDEHLKQVTEIIGAKKIIGVGKYAEKQARNVFRDYPNTTIEICSVWHPSPASPLANRNDGADWRANFYAQLP